MSYFILLEGCIVKNETIVDDIKIAVGIFFFESTIANIAILQYTHSLRITLVVMILGC